MSHYRRCDEAHYNCKFVSKARIVFRPSVLFFKSFRSSSFTPRCGWMFGSLYLCSCMQRGCLNLNCGERWWRSGFLVLEIKVREESSKPVNSTLSYRSIFAPVSLQPGMTEKIGRHYGLHSLCCRGVCEMGSAAAKSMDCYCASPSCMWNLKEGLATHDDQTCIFIPWCHSLAL